MVRSALPRFSNGQCTVSPGSVTLDATNWAAGVPATVTAVDDSVDDDSRICPIQTGSASSTDPNYASLPVTDVTVTVGDNDVAGITLDPTSLTIAEPTGSDIFTLLLTSQPIAPVSVALSASNSQCTVSPGSITLDAINWAAGVPATVTAVDDSAEDGPQPCPIQTGSTTSTDPKYAGLPVPDVTVTVYDNDVADIIVLPNNLIITEPTGSGIFTVTLTTRPTAQVSVALSASNGQCSVFPASITLNTTNWATGVPATVTAVDDSVVDGPQPCPIVTGSTSSADPDYSNLPVSDVTVTVLDNDAPGIAVAPPNLAVSEPTGSAIFTLTLTSQPIDSVVVLLSAKNNQCSVSPHRTELNPTNWATGLPVTVTAVDDLIRDGTQSCPVQIGPTSSADPNYDGLEAYIMPVTVRDLPSVHLPLIVSHWPPILGVPTLQPIANADGDGNYTISWTASPWADLYILEESTSSTMSGAKEIYAGTSTSFDVDGRGAARYYYRVKARNSWSESGWSVVQSVDVLWEAEPNDAYTQANGPIVSGLTYYGTFPGAADPQDYFYFDLSTAHSVELWLTNIPAGQDNNLVLRDSEQYLVRYSGNLGYASEHILPVTLPAGRYYIQVFNYSGGGSTQPYHLRIVY